MKITQFKPIKAVQKSYYKVSGESGVLTVVNSSKNGKRLILSKEMVDKLSLIDSVTVAYDELNKQFAFLKAAVEGHQTFRLRKFEGRMVIYCAELVRNIAEAFELDFSDRVCHTITQGKYVTDEDTGELMLIIEKSMSEVSVSEEHSEVNDDNTQKERD